MDDTFNENAWYRFTDKDGNTFSAFGDNGYVQQAIKEGVPISIDSNGEWYITPKLTTDGKTITAHIPDWFKKTDEYTQWQTYAPQFVSQSMTQDTYDQLQDALTKLGNQGLLRKSLVEDISRYGVTDPKLQEEYFNNILQVGIEGSGGDAAKLNGIFGSDQDESAADFARSMKSMNKEQLSEMMTWLYNIAEQGANGTFTGSQKQMADAVTAIKIINYINDNYSQFGNGEEFKGLLEASTWQKLRTAGDSMLQTMAENFPIINLFARGAYGIGQWINEKPFSLKIEEGRDQVMNSALNGGSLQGREAAMSVGNIVGTVGNIAGTMVMSVALGNVIGGTAAAATPGSFVAKMGQFAQTIPGAAVTDFFLNDIPIDLTFFVTDWARTGDVGKAFYNPEEEQPLFGIPIIGNLGPKAPGGLAMNMAGDAIVDAALPILAIVGNTSFKKLDDWTNGGVTRVREQAAIANFKIQTKIDNIPVFGAGWQKFINYMMGPEHASFVREAKKAAIAEGSTAPYIRAQNLLTLANHAGMTDIAPLYKMLDDELGISKSIKDFAGDANKYGNVGKTNVEWKETHAGVEKTFSKTIEDTLPLKVKQGLLDIERLSELKGQLAEEGGMINAVEAMREIAALEKKVSKLPKKIVDFADRFSQLNKGVEMIGVKLGVSNEDWVAALMENPLWEKYMTRQALTPGGSSFTPTGGSIDPTNSAILNASRKGYYAENYIDPLQALWLKTEALGRAYAWNERAKALVSFEAAQGKIKAGKNGIETSKRLAEIKAEIKTKVEYRAEIGYDTAVSALGNDVDVVGSAFKKVDDLQHLPEKISLKGIYDARKSKNIKQVVDDFESGKIQFAEGVKEKAKLTDSQGADIISNTYAYKGELNRTTKEAVTGSVVFNGDNMIDEISSLYINSDTLEQYHSRAWGVEGANFLFDMKNKAGEYDFGVYGVSPWAREKIASDIELKIARAKEKFLDSGGDEKFNEWLSTFGSKMYEMETAKKALALYNYDQKAMDNYYKAVKEFNEWKAKRPPQGVEEIDEIARLMELNTQLSYVPMINTAGFVDSRPIVEFFGNGRKGSGFQGYTRGEVRRALYEKGYDNITDKTIKTDIDKADNSFTQKTTEPMVLYRGETADTGRSFKVGDKIDSKAWTYTAFTPQYTDPYRDGLTRQGSGRAGDYENKGVIIRYHVKPGTPVYVPHRDELGDWWNQNAAPYKTPPVTQEIVLPRDIDGTVIGVTKDASIFPGTNMEGNYVTVIDVEVDPNSGYAPRLGYDGTQKLQANADNADAFVLIRNENGEVDAGITGLTQRQKKKHKEDTAKADRAAYEKWEAKRQKDLQEWKEKADEWVEGMSKYMASEWKKLTPEQQEADPIGAKIYDEYKKKHPEPEPPKDDPYPESARTKLSRQELAIMEAPENLVDSEAPLDFVIWNWDDSRNTDKNNFNFLTRGENRRALYQKGYDNLDAKTKKQVNKADRAFTQRTTDNVVLYRGEDEFGLRNRAPKVGDKLDSSSWTYLQFLPEETAQYRHGATASNVAKTVFVDQFSEGVLYRYHVKKGTPIFYKPDNGYATGGKTEFVLPRGVDATVTSVKKGFPGELKNKDEILSGLFPATFKGVTIVDVEIDTTNAVTPALKNKLKVDAEGASVEVNVYDNATKEPNTYGIDYNAGMTADGRAFKYTLEDGKVTSLEEIKDAEGMAAALSNVDGSFVIRPETIERIGLRNSQAIGRTIMFYRDNMPDIGLESTFRVTHHPGDWGFVPWPKQNFGLNPWEFSIKDGKLEMGVCPVYVCEPLYRKGNEAKALEGKEIEVASGRKPRNTATLESTPTHENGHALVNRLGILELNRKIDEGVVPALKTVEEGQIELAKTIEALQESMLKDALESLGLPYNTANIAEQAATISLYAHDPVRSMADPTGSKNAFSEVFSEAMRMYQGNGENSSPFCLAIVEQLRKRSEPYTVAANPQKVMNKNGLSTPKGLMKKDGEYNFPKNVKTDKQKAKWLDEWRQKNPYMKGKGLMTEDEYTKANLWDTYFQKEIRAYNSASKTSMPDLLAKRNGDFLEDLAKNSAKRMVQEIEAASVKGFSQELATMVLSRNSSDISEAMNEFIIQRVNQSAQEIAAKMPGGATEENLNRARATLWSEDVVKNDFYTMVSRLSPDIDAGTVKNMIEELFNTQAKGFASADALPIETKSLLAQKEKLQEQLAKDNNYALERGKKADRALRGEYKGDATQVIHYMEGGEDVYVVVKDPVVASILKRPTEFKSTGVAAECLAQAANFFSRTYRIGTTGANPIAFVRNILRDPMQATIQGGFNPLNMMLSPDVFYHTLRGYGLDDATIDTVTTKLRNWSSESTLTAEMRDRGMAKGLSYRNEAERFVKKMNSTINDPTKKFGKIIEAGEAPLETWESLFRNQIAQQSFIKNYKRTGDVNLAMSSAMFDASNSTTNFSHSVGMFKRATSTVPYLSSAINGVRSFWVQFNADPLGMVTRITAGFMVPAMAITAWNLSNKERREAYLNLPEWYRDSHIVLLDLENNVVAFPIPDELTQYYGTARRLMEYTNDANQQGILSIMTQGAFGFLPTEMDGYFNSDGSFDFGRGTAQMLSGLMPQAVTAIYEVVRKEDLFTGQDISTYNGLNTTINTLANLFGTGIKNVANDIGMLCGASEKDLIGKSTMDTLARDLFGMGFDDATNQFMNMIGSPTKFVDGKEVKATGLFAESERLKKEIENLDKQIAVTTGEEKAKYEKEKEDKINAFTKRVGGLVNNYMNLYTITGGLKEWQKAKVVSILTLGSAFSSAGSNSYQYQDTSEAYLDERALAQQRYVNAGLPAGASEESILRGDNSIEIQAALSSLYGAPKQATADFTNSLKNTGLKDIRNEFYDAIEKIYDEADASGTDPDYDLIEKIQARYLQSVDRVLVPIINQYGIDILNNNDFIDEVRRYVNGMVPSNDWKQSVRNAKKYLSKKDFPLASVDVKKWLAQRYSSSMRNRGLDSDAEVTKKLQEIKEDIDAGRKGAAKGKIEELFSGTQRSNYYISSEDFDLLTQYNNMVK